VLWVALHGKEVVYLPEANRVERHGSQIHCVSRGGELVASFSVDDVTVYTGNPRVADTLHRATLEPENDAISDWHS
jgi:hypothetical protein